MNHPAPLVPVWVIQDSRSGNFLGRDLQLYGSLKKAGRLYDPEEALATARSQFGYDYEIHTFWEFDE